MAYTYTNYKTVHTRLKTAIVAAGFKYVHSEKWFNLEYGVFPDALKGQSFTIKFLNSDTTVGTGFESHDHTQLTIEIEFLLDSFRDKYLAKIGTIQEALAGFHGDCKDAPEIIAMELQDYFKFNATYLSDKVIVAFTIPVLHQVRVET